MRPLAASKIFDFTCIPLANVTVWAMLLLNIYAAIIAIIVIAAPAIATAKIMFAIASSSSPDVLPAN